MRGNKGLFAPLLRTLPVQFMEVIELLANLLFKAAIGGLVVLLARQLGRKILLARSIGARLVMGVAILGAIAQIAHQFGRRIAQVYRHLEVREVLAS